MLLGGSEASVVAGVLVVVRDSHRVVEVVGCLGPS
jgi:hypothetical protein